MYFTSLQTEIMIHARITHANGPLLMLLKTLEWLLMPHSASVRYACQSPIKYLLSFSRSFWSHVQSIVTVGWTHFANSRALWIKVGIWTIALYNSIFFFDKYCQSIHFVLFFVQKFNFVIFLVKNIISLFKVHFYSQIHLNNSDYTQVFYSVKSMRKSSQRT